MVRHPASSWSEAEEAVLRRMWAAGQPVVDIMAALGRSKGSVIGRAHRLELGPWPGWADLPPVAAMIERGPRKVGQYRRIDSVVVPFRPPPRPPRALCQYPDRREAEPCAGARCARRDRLELLRRPRPDLQRWQELGAAVTRAPFRLAAPVTREHPIQKAIASTLRLEIAPAGKVSRQGVVWFSIDQANVGGEVPGIRVGRGCIAGVPDLLLLFRGLAYWVEIKAEDGELSIAQRGVMPALLSAWCAVGVARDIREVLALIDAWDIPRARRVAL